jgi:hypothetical protein
MLRPKSIAAAVFETVCWFAVFEQPVSAEEVHRYLFDRKATLAEVKKQLYSDKRIGKSFGFYFLRGHAGSVVNRCRRQYHAVKLWQRAVKFRFLLRATPFLRFAAVGNTVAFGWPEKESDIDIFVVARKNRLFITRAFLTFFTHALGLRRHGDKVAGKFCLSFFVSEVAQNLEKLALAKTDPYLAFWVATLVPLWGDAAAEFYAANRWVWNYFPNLPKPEIKNIQTRRGVLRRVWEALLGDGCEAILRSWQLTRAKTKCTAKAEKTAVVISEQVLKFHEKDRRREFAASWAAKIKSEKRD